MPIPKANGLMDKAYSAGTPPGGDPPSRALADPRDGSGHRDTLHNRVKKSIEAACPDES